MSFADAVGGHLHTLLMGVRAARREATAVDRLVARIVVRADGAGFAGIAVRLTSVREAIGRVRARLAAVEDVLGQASRSVADVPRQSSVQEIDRMLTSVVVALTTAADGISAAEAGVEESGRLVVAALRGGEPGPALFHLRRLGRNLASAGGLADGVRGQVEAALARARQVGAAGPPGGGVVPVPATGAESDTAGRQVTASRAPPADPLSTDAPRPVGPAWVRADPSTLPDTVRAAAGRLAPRPAGSTRPTQGLLNGAPVTSGSGDRSLAADLDHDPLRGPPVTFYDHAESKAAAHLRRSGGTGADLAIDNTVCGTNERDQGYPWTCDKILPAILPAGSRLRVWVTRDGGETWWHRIYTGTGERIVR
ncbi:DddA-like double-stranded DNA deaminase toxin [Polymorphospora sp. NPDC050346]|uniref:DddA-like double-stranded DNA deaminase toxin n=1 Tax=Polymorphospora sp. NPDC050346 TaxID=3155780 RepID=UPI00340F7D68